MRLLHELDEELMPDTTDGRSVVGEELRLFREGCGWICTTCGGHWGRVHRLRDAYRRDASVYLAELTAFRPGDFAVIGSTAPLARAALDVITRPERRTRVLDMWANVVRINPDL